MGISKQELRELFISAGADDVGFVEIDRKAFGSEAADFHSIFPDTKTVVSIVKQGNRDALRSTSTSVADQEFASCSSALVSIAAAALKKLNALGISGLAFPPSFPMDMTRWPGKVWEVSHKTVAVEAGMGQMGVNRVVIHPEFGNHIILGSMLISAEPEVYDSPLEESPCINCGLCVGVCPVGAISRDDGLHFLSCAMHNYHELFGGFQDWIEGVVSSGDVKTYRGKFRDSETMAKWQSLTYGHFYRCSYCMAVCPAGKETVEVFKSDKKAYMEKYVLPLKSKSEPLYVIKGTRAEKAASKKETKEIRYVRNTIRPSSIESFLSGVTLLFDPEKAAGVSLRVHFIFTGKEEVESTVVIADGAVDVSDGLHDKADLTVRADSETWVGMLNEQVLMPVALISGKLKVSNPLLMGKFKSCLVI